MLQNELFVRCLKLYFNSVTNVFWAFGRQLMQHIQHFSDVVRIHATLTSNLKCQYFVKSLCQCEAWGFILIVCC